MREKICKSYWWHSQHSRKFCTSRKNKNAKQLLINNDKNANSGGVPLWSQNMRIWGGTIVCFELAWVGYIVSYSPVWKTHWFLFTIFPTYTIKIEQITKHFSNDVLSIANSRWRDTYYRNEESWPQCHSTTHPFEV